MILPCQSLHVLLPLFSDSALHYTYTYIYSYIYINMHVSLTCTQPFFLTSNSAVIQPPPSSLPSPETGLLCTGVATSPAALATYSSPWGHPKGLHGWREQWQGGGGEEVLSTGLAAQGGACYILQEKTLLTTWSFALIKSFIQMGTNVLRLIIRILFVHFTLQ